MIYPVEMHWDGKAMIPQPRFVALCKKQYTPGECYVLGVNEERSIASHRHYFAAINEAWQNLPEDKVARYPSAEHLRKWALIKSGYHNERSISVRFQEAGRCHRRFYRGRGRICCPTA